MPRYIDADDFDKRLSNPPYTIYDGDMFVEWFDECFKTQPTADVQEVRHAHWYSPVPSDPCEWCSNCHERTRWAFDEGYCPNCGARMDGGENDETDV